MITHAALLLLLPTAPQAPQAARPLAWTVEVTGAAFVILDTPAGVVHGLTAATDWAVWPDAQGRLTLAVDPAEAVRLRLVTYIGPQPADDREPWPMNQDAWFLPVTREHQIETLVRQIASGQEALTAMNPSFDEIGAALERIRGDHP